MRDVEEQQMLERKKELHFACKMLHYVTELLHLLVLIKRFA